MKRIIAIALGLLAVVTLGLTVPAAPAVGAPLPTPEIRVYPDGNDLGYISVGQYFTVHWAVANFGDTTVTVYTEGGYVGCVRDVYPYISTHWLTIGAGQVKYLYTYVQGTCVGNGRVFATAGATTATQYIHVR